MTQVTIIGEEQTNKYKHIKFTHVLTADLTMTKCDGICTPSDWRYIELICKGYTDNKDLMFAYDHPSQRGSGALYVGYFNQGLL